MPRLNLFSTLDMLLTGQILGGDYEVIPNAEPEAQSITLDYDDSDDSTLTLNGMFEVDSEGQMVTGTVMSAEFVTSGSALFQISNIDVDVSDIIHEDDVSGDDIFAALLSGKTKIGGTPTGDDVLYGYGGRDQIKGGAGDDVLHGGGKRDRLDGGAGDDVLKGGGARDHLFGQGGNDHLIGGRGDDFIKGARGDDTIRGGPGKDTLIGGKNSDIFIFKTGDIAGKSKIKRDLIADFSTSDRLDFTNFNGDREDGDLFDALTFSDDGFVEGQAGTIIFEDEKLQIDADGDGDTDYIVKLRGVTELSDGLLLL
ncbi:MAG: hypothetical protein Alpg2KO_20890 [Alphaproteobacteria bacterium]